MSRSSWITKPSLLHCENIVSGRLTSPKQGTTGISTRGTKADLAWRTGDSSDDVVSKHHRNDGRSRHPNRHLLLKAGALARGSRTDKKNLRPVILPSGLLQCVSRAARSDALIMRFATFPVSSRRSETTSSRGLTNDDERVGINSSGP